MWINNIQALLLQILQKQRRIFTGNDDSQIPVAGSRFTGKECFRIRLGKVHGFKAVHILSQGYAQLSGFEEIRLAMQITVFCTQIKQGPLSVKKVLRNRLSFLVNTGKWRQGQRWMDEFSNAQRILVACEREP